MSARRAKKNRERKQLKRQRARRNRSMQSQIGETDHAQMRAFVLRRDGYRCVYCPSVTGLTLDHVVPRAKGGADHPSNLVACCKDCNEYKAGMSPQEWEVRVASMRRAEGAKAL
jgi:5-methylcytosine-specific restriction endonuclease McrA